MKGLPALLVCFCAGIALSFSFPEPSIAPIAWVAIVPLLLLTHDTSPRRCVGLTLSFGLGFFGTLLLWISAVGWIAWFVLVVMEAALFSLFGLGWSRLRALPRASWLIAVPALWVTVELARAYVPVVGFPWGQLAQGQVAIPRILYAARLGGGEVVSFLIVALNVGLCIAILDRGARRIAIGVCALCLPLLPVAASFMEPSDDGPASLKVAIVQGNASPGVQHEDERARVDRHVELTSRLAEEDLDLVVWAESAIGIDPFADADVGSKVATAARAASAPMIVGANLDSGDNYLVTTLHVSEDGAIVDRYQKTHLVPFGEYVPARRFLGWIPMLDQVPRDALAGDALKNFDIAGQEIATVISFEGDFGPLVRDRIDAGGRILVVATNTSTWKDSWASAQHVAMSQVRAAENAVPVVHAALSGISAFIDKHGQVLDDSPLYEEATLVRYVPPATSASIYARTGEWFPWSCAIGCLAAMVWSRRRQRADTVTT